VARTERLPINVPGTGNELTARISTAALSRHLYSITATSSTPKEAVGLARALAVDSAAACTQAAGYG
jgi:hypothetical protein